MPRRLGMQMTTGRPLLEMPAAAAAVPPAPARRSAAGRPAAPGGALSLLRGLRIMETLAERDGGLSLAELARTLAVNKAIASRLADALVDAGFVFRHELTGLYELTYKLSNLGLRKLDRSRLLDQAGGLLRRLAERTGELVRLAVVEQRRRITWVLAAAGENRSLRIDPSYRLEVGLATHATGKAWLATLDEREAWALIEAQGLHRHTAHSLTRRSDILADLARAAGRGYATSYEENEPGVGAVAAPIMVRLVAGGQTCVGVISLAAPVYRMSREELEAQAPLVLRVAGQLAAIWPIDAPLAAAAGRATDSALTV